MKKRYQLTVNVYTRELAAALASKGNEVLYAGMDEKDQIYFRFARSKKLDRAANRYWSGTLKVNVRIYNDTLNELIKRAFQSKFDES